MAGVMGIDARAQYGAMVHMRWRVIVNSLRTRRGKFELGASIFSSGFSLLIWLGAGIGLGFGAYQFAASNQLRMLPLLLWPVLLMWQIFPVMLTSFQGNVDLSILLRFPVSFASYALLYVLFGIFDLSSLLGGVALLGIWIGTVVARPSLAFWAALSLALFAVFNIVLTRMIFAWLDRWLAQRKTREILGSLILFSFLALQFLNPAFHQRGRHHSSAHISAAHAERMADRLQRPLPPALAASAIQLAGQDHALESSVPLGWLTLYVIGIAGLLGLRLRAEYRGESLGEAPSRTDRVKSQPVRDTPLREIRPSLHDSGKIGAIFEKEVRYLSRSGIMLYSLLAPLVLLFLFGGTSRSGHASAFQYAFPVGVAYGFLGLTRLIGNSLGGEAAGIQLYFLSPTPFRTVMLAKNLVQIVLFCLELALVCAIVWLRFGMPARQIIAATFCWLLFALPVQLALGNVFSITMAYRMTLTRMSREQGAMGNGLLSLLVQLVLFAIGAAVYFSLAYTGHQQLAAPVFLVLAGCGILAWFYSLSAVDRLATNRREALTAALVRGT